MEGGCWFQASVTPSKISRKSAPAEGGTGAALTGTTSMYGSRERISCTGTVMVCGAVPLSVGNDTRTVTPVTVSGPLLLKRPSR